MDILRNKAQTWNVSNQQHIFQKMADPILYTSLRLSLNCWSFTLLVPFLEAEEKLFKLFLSTATCEMGITRRNANNVPQWYEPICLKYIQTCLDKLQITYLKQRRWSIVRFWQKALACFLLNAMCQEKMIEMSIWILKELLSLPIPFTCYW